MAVKSLSNSSILQPFQTNSMLGDYESNYFHHLESVRLGGPAASVSFSNLARYSDYQHLQIRAVTRNTASSNGNAVIYRINGDTGSNYSWHWLLGNGSAVQSGGDVNQTSIFEYSTVASDEATGAFSASVIDILDAFDTTKYKQTRTLVGRATSRNHVSLSSGSWRNTAAITSYSITPSNGTWAAGSRFSLYGIKARS